MNMDELYKVVEISVQEIKSITDNGKYRSREEIDNVYKLMDIIKDFKCLEDMDDGYSMDGRSYRGSYDGSYRGRGSGAKRYADGRYAPHSHDGRGSYRGYSRDEARDEYVQQLHELMENAPDEQTRQSIQRMIQQMDK